MSSPRLRTIRTAYEKYFKTLQRDSDIETECPHEPAEGQPLNDYQLFVRKSSAKRKYRILSPRTRIKEIAKDWRLRRQNPKVGNQHEGDHNSNRNYNDYHHPNR